MKLTLLDHGDPSVGIFPTSYDIDCPFERGDVEPEDLENFRKGVEDLFAEFYDYKLRGLYDFELLKLQQ